MISGVLSTREAGEIAKVSGYTVRKWIDAGLLPAYRIPGSKHRRIRPGDLAAFMKKRGVPAGVDKVNLFDIGSLRPLLDSTGQSVVSLRQPDGTLSDEPSPQQARWTRPQWMTIDKMVTREFTEASPITHSLIDAGLVFDGFDGVSKMLLETYPTEHGEAIVPDDPAEAFALKNRIVGDPPEIVDTRVRVTSLPLPITHSKCKLIGENFSESLRAVALAARNVGETVEATLLRAIGGEPNLPLTDTLHRAEELLLEKRHFGPYKRLGNFVVTMIPEVLRIVVGLAVTTIVDGDDVKVIGIYVPQIRRDFYGNCGICRLANHPRRVRPSRITMDGR